MIKNLSLVWTDEFDSFGEFKLEPYQILAIGQVLGLEIVKQGKDYQLSYFDKKTVTDRLIKMGVLVKPEERKK